MARSHMPYRILLLPRDKDQRVTKKSDKLQNPISTVTVTVESAIGLTVTKRNTVTESDSHKI